MERLTENYLNKLGGVIFRHCHQEDCDGDCMSCGVQVEAEHKLKRYEDLEEQGLLLRLPCPIGATVYDIKWWDEKEESVVVGGNRYFRRIQEHKISKSTFGYFDIDSFGKTVFLTKAEAEAALEKMKGEEHE